MRAKQHYTDLPRIKPRSVKAMREFLNRHRRYWTMNSWNRSSSYAVCVKVGRLKMTQEQHNACYELLTCPDCLDYSGFNDRLSHFDAENAYDWQAGQNGRSGGYIVLYRGALKPSGYKSHCIDCGQQCMEPATPERNRCGRCGKNSRVNYESPHLKVEVYPGKGVDDCGTEVTEMSDSEVVSRFRLVWAFDTAVEEAVAAFVETAMNSDVVEQERPREVEIVNVAIPKQSGKKGGSES